ncbi:MAG: hypothetical protein KDD64_14915, partial [Bdellovibrionales bacterium]|nr:hypothetical protein [Bdellovibrionales bacterium]
MRPKSRDLNVFGLSLLDVMCGALGVFLFLLLAVLSNEKDKQDPLTLREREELRELREENPKLKNENTDLRDQNSDLHDENEELRKKQGSVSEERDTLRALSVVMSWEGAGVDMDLWLRAPDGRWFGPKIEYRKGVRTASRSVDEWEGPNWESNIFPRVSEGIWSVCFRMQSKPPASGQVTVRGFLFANFSKDYQVTWQLGSAYPAEVGKTYLWMTFEHKDGKLTYFELSDEEKQSLEAKFNNEGSGPPELLWEPGEKEKREKERREEEERKKKAKETEKLS